MSDINFQKELTNKLSNICSLVPVGTPWMGFDLRSKPFGVQLYQGQILSRTLYPVHFSYVETHKTIVTEDEWNTYANNHNGFCPYFSYGDGVETYRMPKIIDVYPRFGNSSEAGEYREAGLPNITGSTSKFQLDYTDRTGLSGVSGAFEVCVSTGSTDSGGGTDVCAFSRFDASRSNSIYGKANTVQPPTVNMLLGEYVFSDVGEVSQATEDIVISTIEKIEQLENLQSAYIKKSDISSYVVETYVSGTSGYRIYSDGWIEQWGRNSVSGDGTYTVTLLKNMRDTNYNITQWIAFQGSSKTQYDNGLSITQLTTSSFTYNSYAYANTLIWYICGY